MPFIVRGPGVRANAVVRGFGANVDVAPTLADFAGFTIPAAAAIDGRSLRPLFRTGIAPSAQVRTELLFEHEGFNISPAGTPGGRGCGTGWMRPGGHPEFKGLCSCGNPMDHWISSVNNTFKGLRVMDAAANLDLKFVQYDDDVNFRELFNLTADPHELVNLARVPAMAPVVERLAERLAQLRNCSAAGEDTEECP